MRPAFRFVFPSRYFITRAALPLGIVILATLATGLSSCGSFDLGSQRPTEINVNAENPNWNADIQRVMALKCMNCHADPRPNHAPAGTPVINFANEVIFKKRDVITRVWERVFRSPDKPMPPDFGTPLSSSERLALKKYLSINGVDTTVTTPATPGPGGGGGGGTPTVELSGAYRDKCQSCHGVQGEGGNGKKLAGTTISEDTYISKVRNGVTGTIMDDYLPSAISDAALKADYAALKTLK
jgi:Cytochrome C oxidase, cbb3-type, subunit III